MYLNVVYEIVKVRSRECSWLLTPEQEEERRKKEATKDRLHQNYLKRKANGTQKKYEERYKERRVELKSEKKAALFAEGATLGATACAPVPVSDVAV